MTDERPLFLFNISPVRYVSSGDSLTLEEKLAGVIKLYTVIKYFHIYKDEIAEKWDQSFEEYLSLVQNTNSDKEYFDLIQTMLAPLNDSHVFVEHESMLDFASLFVPPVMFEWIENKAIVTAFDPELKDVLFLGDEVLAIDDVTISEMIEQKRVNVSHANEQSLISIAVTPANFTGTENSPVKFKIKRNNEDMVIDLKKNTFVFYILGMGINQINPVQVMDNNIGYLNLAYLTDSESLNVGVEQIKNTDGLIIDLRNSYPTISFYDFLQLFCNKKTAIRQDAVPIVSADASMVQSSISWCFPKDKDLYNKPVVVLIDKTMMSRPEDIAIALKAFDNVTFVGEQTQGTDGEMTKIYLPCNGTVSFTGQLVKFGNGEDFQGVGIMPDIHVERTIEGVKNGEDEILNKALSLFQ